MVKKNKNKTNKPVERQCSFISGMINLRSTSNLSGEGWINTGLLPMSGTTNEWLLGTLRDGETVSFSSVDRDS